MFGTTKAERNGNQAQPWGSVQHIVNKGFSDAQPRGFMTSLLRGKEMDGTPYSVGPASIR